MKVSVVTATYNRIHLLPKLYESLVRNYEEHHDMEWVIMDDGSSDDTKNVVKKWIKEAKFDIKYYYQENAGKMVAINNAMEYVTGEVCTEIDSDDYLVDGAIKMISDDYEKISDENIYGIVYKRKIINKDTYVPTNFDGMIIRLYDLHNRLGYDFDMVLTFKTDIRKKYKYILEKNEKFITEARMYYKMDQDYDGMMFKNQDVIVCEYMEDGYSKNIIKTFKAYPHGYYKYFKECLSYCSRNVLFKKRLYFIKHYILFSYLIGLTKREALKDIKGLNKLLLLLLIIPGYMKAKRF